MKRKEFVDAIYASTQQGLVTIRDYNKKDNSCFIVFDREYDYPDVTFEHLEFISRLAKTRKIDFHAKKFANGCETCDYGSSYTIELRLRDMGITLE